MTSGLLKKFVSSAPSSPGIYTFKKRSRKLYTGKAANLKARLHSYLGITDPRIQKMISLAQTIEFKPTDSDIEALILESQYIKKFKPVFNIMLRDDKQYGFVGFTHSTSSGQAEKYPKIFITHQPPKAYKLTSLQANYIGPFTDVGALKTTLRYLRRIFPYCTCKQPHNNYCLNYHIGKCVGTCCLKLKSKNEKVKITIQNSKLKEYRKNIKAIKDILSGKKNDLIKNLEKEMVALGKKHKFEKAIELQNKIEKIKRVFENAKILNTKYLILNTESDTRPQNTLKELARLLKIDHAPSRIEAYDIANIQGKYAVGAMAVFVDGKPNKNEYRKFMIRNFDMSKFRNIDISASGGDIGMLKEVLIRRLNHPEWTYPDLILVDGGKAQFNATLRAISNLEFLISKQVQNPKFKIRNKISIIALMKNKRHQGEKIYIAGREKPISLSQLPTSVKNLLLYIDSEAHRFAIGYYRKLHRKLFK